MKKFGLLIASLALLLGSCATPKLENSVWCTMKNVNNGNTEGIMIESIYFLPDGKANICRSIVADSALVVAPYKYADADYTIDGKLTNGANVNLSAKVLNAGDLKAKGIVNVSKSLLLLYKEGEKDATVYVKNPNIEIKHSHNYEKK